MTRQSVLIVGAGYTGRRLASYLDRQGHTVTSAKRHGDNARSITVDLDNPSSLDTLREHVADQTDLHVVYLVPPSGDLADEHATDSRLHALLDALPITTARFVLASTTGVYGDHAGASVNEQTPLQPSSRRAKARVAAERTLAQWAKQSGVSTVVLRIAGIYGPGRLPIDALRNGTPMVATNDSGPGNRIHVDDLVSCFAAALCHAKPPAVINISDGDHRTTAQFAEDVSMLANLPAPVTVNLETARRDFSPMRLSFILESRALDNTVLTHELGVNLQYANPRDGIRASLAEALDRDD